MADFLRGEDDEIASFFAFQDVITAVLGILILIALQLAFTINVVHGEHGNETAPAEGPIVSEEEFEQLRERKLELEQRLTVLREHNQELLEKRRRSEVVGISVESLLASVEILRAESSDLISRLDELRATVEEREKNLSQDAKRLGLEDTQHRIAKLTKELESRERQNESLVRELEALHAQAKDAIGRLGREKRRNSIWLIPEPDLDGKKPLLITVNERHMRFEEFNKPESLKVLSTSSLTDSFKAGVKGCSPRSYKIVFLFKPSGAKYFEKVIDLAKMEGFQVGYDPIEESKEVIFSLPE